MGAGFIVGAKAAVALPGAAPAEACALAAASLTETLADATCSGVACSADEACADGLSFEAACDTVDPADLAAVLELVAEVLVAGVSASLQPTKLVDRIAALAAIRVTRLTTNRPEPSREGGRDTGEEQKGHVASLLLMWRWHSTQRMSTPICYANDGACLSTNQRGSNGPKKKPPAAAGSSLK